MKRTVTLSLLAAAGLTGCQAPLPSLGFGDGLVNAGPEAAGRIVVRGDGNVLNVVTGRGNRTVHAPRMGVVTETEATTLTVAPEPAKAAQEPEPPLTED